MILEVMVHAANCGICTHPNINCFIYEVVNLLRNCLAHDSKNATFLQGFKVNWTWLHGVTRNMNLLCKVKGIMHGTTERTGIVAFIQLDCVLHCFKSVFCLLADVSIQFPLSLYTIQMFLYVHWNCRYGLHQAQLLHWQPVKLRLFKWLRKDDTLGALLTTNGSWFQIWKSNVSKRLCFIFSPLGLSRW